jgi:hypothetical protein
MKQQELAPVKPSREKGALNFIHYDETTTRCSGSPCVGGQDLGAGEIESPRRRGVASAPRSPPRHENRGRGSHRARPRSSNARSDNLSYINGLRVPRQKLASIPPRTQQWHPEQGVICLGCRDEAQDGRTRPPNSCSQCFQKLQCFWLQSMDCRFGQHHARTHLLIAKNRVTPGSLTYHDMS